MKYDKSVIKHFIKEYQGRNKQIINTETFDVDDFFSLNNDIEPMQLNEDTSQQVLFNELDQLVYTTCTQREYTLFWLLCEGKTFEDLARIFELTEVRVRQIYNNLLDKIENMR